MTSRPLPSDGCIDPSSAPALVAACFVMAVGGLEFSIMPLFLGGLGLVGFFWMLKSNQFDDPDGDAHRILSDEYDDKPKE